MQIESPIFSASKRDAILSGFLNAAGMLARPLGRRGFGRALKLVRSLRHGTGFTRVMLGPDAPFFFPLADGYWSRRMFLDEREYEPELGFVLKRAGALPFAFLDCGANMGYWSVLASSRNYGSRPSLAIEPSTSTLAVLKLNQRLNGNRFEVLHRAIARCTGRTVRLYGAGHSARSLDPEWTAGGTFEEVTTLSLDNAAKGCVGPSQFPPLIKLDVEGAEVDALEGGQALIERGALFCYEDHGRDETHSVSAYMVGRGLQIWLFENGGLRQIHSLAELTGIKRHRKQGYNFFAFRGHSPWAPLFAQGESGQ